MHIFQFYLISCAYFSWPYFAVIFIISLKVKVYMFSLELYIDTIILLLYMISLLLVFLNLDILVGCC